MKGTIVIMPHPKDIIDVDPQIIADLKARLSSPGMTEEEKRESDEQDKLER